MEDKVFSLYKKANAKHLAAAPWTTRKAADNTGFSKSGGSVLRRHICG